MARRSCRKISSPPAVQAITLRGQTVNYRLRRSAAARTCRIHVTSDEVVVILPRRAAEKHATALLHAQADWVLKHLVKANEQRSASVRAAGLGDRQILLRGRPVDLAVECNQTRRPLVTASTDRITVRLKERSGDPQATLESWLRNQARRELLARVAVHAKAVTNQPTRIAVRDQRTRWGSCSSSGTVSFSWRLIMTPPAVLDYVVIHELVHLDIPNHSKSFWSKVGQICPDFELHRQWLRTHEAVVMRPLGVCIGNPAARS